MKKSVFIGYDSPHPEAFAVAARSVHRSIELLTPNWAIRGLQLAALQRQGLYTRPMHLDTQGRLVDDISGAPMSTEFANSRFLVPHLHSRYDRSGLALFMDCDMFVLGDIREPFRIAQADPSKAVWVVKHALSPVLGDAEGLKMDNQVQTHYARKCWSSFMIFNCSHPAVRALTPELVNSMRGLDLHQFAWLKDDQIGELPARWNWLVGLQEEPENVANIHWTTGGPWLEGFENEPYAEMWNEALTDWTENPARP